MPRQRWESKLGIILAVAGSAVGLGNFLRFPVKAAQNGGGAFMIPYFIALLVVGLPLMWIEWTIGRFGGGFGHSTAPGMFHNMWEKNRFIKYFGIIGIFGPTVIFIYYTYIESWVLGYSFFALTGKYSSIIDPESMKTFLKTYQGDIPGQFFSGSSLSYTFFLIAFLINIVIVCFSINVGIEKVCKYGVPILIVFGFILMYRVLTLGAPDATKPDNNVVNGLKYLWTPKWSALLDAKIWLAASGQIFFTLGCGLGAILTYASYLTKDDDVVLSGLEASAANEFIEVVMAGTIVIGAAFAFFGFTNMKPIADEGAFNLGFVTMPLILQKMAFGNIMGFLWFGLLFIAGITSSISLALPAIAFLEDEFNLSKKKASLIFAFGSFALCHFVIFFLARGVLDEMDFWGGTFCPVVFALIEVVLFAWIFGMDRAWTEMHAGSDISIPRFYRFIIKYVTPLFLFFILGFWLVVEGVPVLFLQKSASTGKPFFVKNVNFNYVVKDLNDLEKVAITGKPFFSKIVNFNFVIKDLNDLQKFSVVEEPFISNNVNFNFVIKDMNDLKRIADTEEQLNNKNVNFSLDVKDLNDLEKIADANEPFLTKRTNFNYVVKDLNDLEKIAGLEEPFFISNVNFSLSIGDLNDLEKIVSADEPLFTERMNFAFVARDLNDLEKIASIDIFTTKEIENIPYIIITRVMLILLFIILVTLVWIVWRRKKQQLPENLSGELNSNK